MWNRHGDSDGSRWKYPLATAVLCAALGLSQTALGQTPAQESPAAPGSTRASAPRVEDPGNTAASSTATVTTPPVVAIQTGAPQPLSQNLASPLPPAPSASPAVVKVGGGMILLYSNNYDPSYDQQGNKKKNYFDAWRASIVLDSKLDRYGMHIEFRARDRGLRWMPTSAWLEECYASVDIIKPGTDWGPMNLKIGKTYAMFGRVWDNSFYGSMAFRDGLKLDPNWGLSLEGALNATQPWGARYFAQYFMLDGQTSTAAINRDTISQVLPNTANSGIGSRKRERFIGRIEPFYKLPSLETVLRLGLSVDYFTADATDTQSDADIAAMTRVKSQDNTEKVFRIGADLAATVKWFSAWVEYAHQSGAHVTSFPVPPRADVASTPMVNEARLGRGSEDVTYWMAGGNFVWTRYTLQYNWSNGFYKDVESPDLPGRPVGDHKEWIHNPSVQVAVNDQIKLIFEAPMWKRKSLAGLLPIDPRQVGLTTQGQEEVVEKQFLITLHGKF